MKDRITVRHRDRSPTSYSYFVLMQQGEYTVFYLSLELRRGIYSSAYESSTS
jgi:hypothetical protein